MTAPMGPETPGMWSTDPWTYPDERYYYGWWEQSPPPAPASDGDLKTLVVDQLKRNVHTGQERIQVDVAQGVVILGGEVSSWLAKRVAGDDAWDTAGVVDVRNELEVTAGVR